MATRWHPTPHRGGYRGILHTGALGLGAVVGTPLCGLLAAGAGFRVMSIAPADVRAASLD